MSGTKAGGQKRRQRGIKEFGSEEAWLEHMHKLASKGGKKGTEGGFKSKKVGKDGLTGKERARIAGAKGGRISKRS